MYFGHPGQGLLTLKEVQPATPEQYLLAMYSILAQAWGRQHWWPARTSFEVVVGAFLTQNTSWKNVEIALRQLRSARVLSISGIRRIPIRRLEKLVRSSGYFRQKARRLKKFVTFVDRCYGGSLRKMFEQPTAKLREELLALEGVGPETADSILLYAGQHPIFVVDAYTRRSIWGVQTSPQWMKNCAPFLSEGCRKTYRRQPLPINPQEPLRTCLLQ